MQLWLRERVTAGAGSLNRSRSENRKSRARGGDTRRFSQNSSAAPAGAGIRDPILRARLLELQYRGAALPLNVLAKRDRKRTPPPAVENPSRGRGRPVR